MLDLHDITVTVPDGEATLSILRGADLQVGAGEVVSVSGRSGSGKSTLLAIAGLLRRPQQGTVTLQGRDANAMSERERTRARRDLIGIIYQSAELFPSLSAIQQLELVAHISGSLDAAARERAGSLLGIVGLGDRRDNLPGKPSGGERQRVGVARALMNEPSILLADEPTASLDPDRGREIMELITAEARRRNLAAVVVTHDPAHRDLFDRAYDLAAGTLSSPSTGSASGTAPGSTGA